MTDEHTETDRTETERAKTDPEAGDDEDDTGHLADLPDGAGCTEIWEHISESRDE